jgi:tRNA 2-thiouridine synthesizing protein E
LTLAPDHWDAVRALQEYYAKHQDTAVNTRELHDALGEKFHRQGGMRFLYQLFPGGPVAQGCRLAGLKAPAGAVDKGFGSVV